MPRVMEIAIQRRFWRVLHTERRISTRRQVSNGVEISPRWFIWSMVWLTSMRRPLRSRLLAYSRPNGHDNTARWLASSRHGCAWQQFNQTPSSSMGTVQWAVAGGHLRMVWLPGQPWQSVSSNQVCICPHPQTLTFGKPWFKPTTKSGRHSPFPYPLPLQCLEAELSPGHPPVGLTPFT
jgi:hypothetical protein